MNTSVSRVSAGDSANLEGDNRLQEALESFKRLLLPRELSQLANSPYPDAANVAALMQELNNINSKRFLKLGESCRPFLEFVQHFSPVLDVYIQGDQSSIAPLVWGSVRLVVQLASGFFDYFVKMSEMFQRIGRICPTMEEIGGIFPDDEKLKDSIRVLYAISIEFCIKALCFLRKSGLKQFAKSTWKPFKLEFQDIETELADRREILNDQIRAASEKAAAFARQKALIYQEEGYRHRKYEVNQWDRSQEWRIQQDNHKKENTMDELLAKLSDHNYTRCFLNAKDLRHPDTGKVFFESPKFKSWYDGSGGPLLWYQGIPGAGKTILASAVIDHLLDNVGGVDEAIIYFFCDSQDSRSLERRTLLSSLLKQIITLNRPLPAALHSELETKFSNSQKQPSLQTLQGLLTTHIQQKHLTYIVVDGVDELEVRDRQHILDQFNGMFDQLRSKLKVFILSRPEIDLPRASRKAILSSPQSAPRPELDAYIRDNLQKFDNLISFPSDFLSEIQKALTDGADGMFLWVEFQLREIENKESMTDIRRVIQDLPRGLDETYARILRKIMERRNPEKALKIFKWLSTSRRPLTLEELQEAIAINTDDTYHSQINSRKTADSFFELRNCANLAILNERDSTVQFAHSTVRDFLLKESTRTEFPDLFLDSISAKSEICNACLTYLSLSDFETQIARKEPPPPPPNESILESPASWLPALLKPQSILAKLARFYLNWRQVKYPPKSPALFHKKINQPPSRLELLCKSFHFLDYARQNWIHHCDDLVNTAKEAKSWQMFRTILGKALPFDHIPWEQNSSHSELEYFDAFSWALRNSNLSVVTLMFDEMTATERQRYLNINLGDAKEPLLHVAAGLWSEGIVALLLINGADPSSSYNGTTAIARASANGRLEIVRILLAAKADVNTAAAEYGRTALQAAAEGGHLDVVERLLAAAADVNAAAAKYRGRTALQAAAEGGHLDVVERLLAAKADVNAAAGIDGRTALQAAAGAGHLDVVERLLAAAADVNAAAAEDSGRTALQAAAGGGHLDVVERLLAAKSDVNAAPAKYNGRTALQAAAGGGHLDVVERLLAAKADVNAAAGIDGRTALQVAAGGGHLDVVERLLAARAEVNAAAATESGRTALQAAAEGGHLDVVERLLAAKADVNAAAKYRGRTALQAAAGGGHLNVVERLLAAKADVNAAAAKYDGRTALQAAAEGGHLDVVKRLLAAKVDVNAAVKYDGRTALQAAAGGGHLDVVEKLLAAKADVNAAAAKYDGRTALQAAAGGGHLNVVQRLLAAAAEVNAAAAENSGRTALQAAAGGGHLDVVERLLAAKSDVNAAPAKYNGRTALQAAAGGGHLDVVERLLAAKADINAAAGIDGRTALQAAAGGGHLDVVERLLAAKADVNAAAAKYDGRTALQVAAEGGHLDVVERLLATKADVNAAAAENSGRTALQAAAEAGHLDVVERLLVAKADVNAAAAKYDGLTALQAAAEGGHLDVVERLLAAAADVNAAAAEHDGRTAIQAAAEGGHLDIVERLLAAKADVITAIGYDRRTALQAAAEGGHLDVVEKLLAAKVDVNATITKYDRRIALRVAAEGGHLDVVERLLAAGADVNANPEYELTALQAAAKSGHLEVVERLLTAKADVNPAVNSKYRRTALQAAAESGHLGIVERLLSAAADVNAAAAEHGGRTALQIAAEGGHLDVVERLLAAKADVNAAAAEDSGRTALQAAAGGGHLDVVERLLAAKADVNAAPAKYDGRTALQAAARGGHLDVVERLLAVKANVNAAAAEHDGRTALQAAAGGGHLDVVERLLAAKADVNAAAAKYDGLTALQAAAEGGHRDVVKRLLAAKIDANAAATFSINGRTTLEAASPRRRRKATSGCSETLT